MKENKMLKERFKESYETNVFVMMRYRDDEKYILIETSIRTALSKYGLKSRLAKDRAYFDNLWDNIIFYMKNSKYGLAVFEEIDDRDFNPNISMELGYLYALDCRCLLLKDKRMPRLPTDICGKIYKDFDTYDIEKSIENRITEWCENDLGLLPVTQNKNINKEDIHLIYDTESEGIPLNSWTVYSTVGGFDDRIMVDKKSENDSPYFSLNAFSTEFIGVNKSVRILHGYVEFEYKIISGDPSALNLYVCMIPMQETGIGRVGLIEVGTSVQDDPRNGKSPYRKRYFFPAEHYADNKWHKADFIFDFRKTPTAFYSILAPRINEGCDKVAPGHFLISGIKICNLENA
ncbi:MAG: hypothetical protein GF353_23915 [Candidatus Lokiarchaeota archaeon]|nr:hypothetical protein [Candidatus Lokiarchaeota archaeon]